MNRNVNDEKITNVDVMNRVFEVTKEAGYYEKADAIMDYFSPCEYDERKLPHFDFEFLTTLNFGGSEGIYLDCYLEGNFSEDGPSKIRCGTFKTLETSLGAMNIMGELSGSLIYYFSKIMNKGFSRYKPLDSKRT